MGAMMNQPPSVGTNNMPSGLGGLYGVMADPTAGLNDESMALLKKQAMGDTLMGVGTSLLGQGYSATPMSGFEGIATAMSGAPGLYNTALRNHGMNMRRNGLIGSDDQMLGEVQVTGVKKPLMTPNQLMKSPSPAAHSNPMVPGYRPFYSVFGGM